MIKHFCALKMKEDATKEQIEDFITHMNDFVRHIPGVHHWTIGRCNPYYGSASTEWDYAFSCEWDDEKAVEVYLKHPFHPSIGPYMEAAVEKYHVVDFDFDEIQDSPSHLRRDTMTADA